MSQINSLHFQFAFFVHSENTELNPNSIYTMLYHPITRKVNMTLHHHNISYYY